MHDTVGITSTTYDPLRLVSAQHAPLGGRITYSYDPVNRRSTMRDPDNGRFTYSYDAASRMTRVLNPQNKRTSFGYDAAGRQIQQIHGNAARTTQAYDPAGRLTLQVQAEGFGLARRTSYSYDAAGRRVLGRESNNVRTSWTYDAAGQLVREARGLVTLTCGGLPMAVPETLGMPGVCGYSDFLTTHINDPAGNRLLMNESGFRTTATYDAANELLVEKTGSARTTYQYDPNGNRTRKEAPIGLTLYHWDHLGSQVSEAAASAPASRRMSSSFYNAVKPSYHLKRSTCMTNEPSQSPEGSDSDPLVEYDAKGRPCRVTDRLGDGKIITYYYDCSGQIMPPPPSDQSSNVEPDGPFIVGE